MGERFSTMVLVVIGFFLLGLGLSANAAVKVLQYNADGSVKGISSGNDNKAKKNSGSSKNSAKDRSNPFSLTNHFVEGELLVVNPSRHFEVNVR
ncbi:MAG: hypothetical protein HQ513_08860, partial [Rhodospirillales bacterium]|nr:hypothetical protein [Rhodospirillales bacterium]